MILPHFYQTLLVVGASLLVASMSGSAIATEKANRPLTEPATSQLAEDIVNENKEVGVQPKLICSLISRHARQNNIPESFFARLIWKESRFDANAISPAGAEGIAQFMPATARKRGLADSFDVEQAIPASAAYLAELKGLFGNLGLAAAAYNAGENRVARWLSAGGFLPLETENYVLDITGEAADVFTDPKRQAALRPLDQKMAFADACEKLPVLKIRTKPMTSVSRKPWAIIVAGGVRQTAAVRSWERMAAATGFKIAADEVYVSKRRLAGGRGGNYSVRIGADTRTEANNICYKLKASGGACVVLKNR